jgi:hypothetical protein
MVKLTKKQEEKKQEEKRTRKVLDAYDSIVERRPDIDAKELLEEFRNWHWPGLFYLQEVLLLRRLDNGARRHRRASEELYALLYPPREPDPPFNEVEEKWLVKQTRGVDADAA